MKVRVFLRILIVYVRVFESVYVACSMYVDLCLHAGAMNMERWEAMKGISTSRTNERSMSYMCICMA